MKKNVICFFVVCLLLLVEASMVQGVTLFGPKRYDRTAGPPNVYNDSVYATAGSAVLIVRNGKEKDKHRVTSAHVFINDRQVLFPVDFKKKIPVLEVPVYIDSMNDISLELRGKPGTFLILEITREAVSPPEVTLSVEPDTIMAGNSSLLFWSSSNADTCELDQDIGLVNLNENQGYPVFPLEETTYTITCSGPGGVTEDNVTVSVLPPINISVIEPAPDKTVNAPDILVHGVVTNPTNNETGITVNGTPVQLNGAVFYMNNLQLKEGENLITVKALDIDGNTAESTVIIYLDTSEPTNRTEMNINPEAGTAPFTTSLTVDTYLSFAQAGLPVLTVSGPDAATETWISDTEIDLEFTVPGAYTLTYELDDDHGGTYRSRVMVNVLDNTKLDALLKTKWDRMKEALSAGDVEGSLGYFLETSKNKYRDAFNAKISDLPQVFTNMQNIEMIYIRDGIAKYRVNREHQIDGQSVTITYYIYFMTDGRGLWKIDQF